MHVYEKLRSEIDKRNLSVTDAAKLLGMSRPAFSNVINGNASLSIALALALQSKFGMNAKKLLIAQLSEQFAKAVREQANG